MWYCPQSWQQTAAVKLESGITGSWRAVPVKRGTGWASVTSQWVYCPPVATAGTAVWQMPFLHFRLTNNEWYTICYTTCLCLSWSLLLIKSKALQLLHVFVTGSLGEWPFPALPGGLLSGDYHILKPTMWLPSAPSGPQSATIPLLEGVYLSLLAMQVCVNFL